MLRLQAEVHLVIMRRREERLTEFRTPCLGLVGFDKFRENVLSGEPAPEEKYLCFIRFYEVVLGRQRLESELWPIRRRGSIPMSFVAVENVEGVAL